MQAACCAILIGALTAVAAPAVGASTTPPSATRPRPCLVPGLDQPLDRVWRPDLRSAIAYARHRRGDVAFAVRTQDRLYGYRPDHQEWSASVLKAMLMVAYLNGRSVAGRPLNAYDRSLLFPMITRSDNAAANKLDELIGTGGLQALAAHVGMTHFRAVQPIWGESRITARDQTTFFLHIDRYIVPRHRAYGMHLLASIVPSQRWGIGQVAPPGWKLYFKGGWGAGTGLIDNQVVLLSRGCARISIAVLTMHDGSHPYGQQTLKAIFHRLLSGLPIAAHRRYR